MKKNSITLESGLIKSKNNLNAIKFICALLVILHHAYPLSKGLSYIDPIMSLSNGQLNLGNLCVCIFLFIAGLLITKSLARSKNGIDFFKKRLKRLLPGLIIVVLITAFIIGPIFSTLSLNQYFYDISVYKYAFMNSIMIINHDLPVFVNNIYNTSPNGSLWTLPVEFCCYIYVYLISKMKFLQENKAIIFIPCIVLACIFQSYIIKLFPAIWPAIQLVLFFTVAMLMYIYRSKIKINFYGVIFMSFLTLVAIYFNFYLYINIIIIPYIVCYIAFKMKEFKLLNHLGNYSYEIYLIGFPIQQCVSGIFGVNGMNPYLNFFISVPIVIVLAILLHKIVNKIIKK